MAWLQGGPFLEVSFLLKEKVSRKDTLIWILDRLKLLPFEIELVTEALEKEIEEFAAGYPFDVDAPDSIIMHYLQLNLYVNILGKRKAVLQIEEIAPETIMVDFWFYGYVEDALEWEQIGIKDQDMPVFKEFLIELYNVYDYIVGGICIEGNMLDIFKCGKTYPDINYRFDKLSPQCFSDWPFYFATVIWNEKVAAIDPLFPNSRRIQNSGVLIEYETPPLYS